MPIAATTKHSEFSIPLQGPKNYLPVKHILTQICSRTRVISAPLNPARSLIGISDGATLTCETQFLRMRHARIYCPQHDRYLPNHSNAPTTATNHITPPCNTLNDFHTHSILPAYLISQLMEYSRLPMIPIPALLRRRLSRLYSSHRAVADNKPSGALRNELATLSEPHLLFQSQLLERAGAEAPRPSTASDDLGSLDSGSMESNSPPVEEVGSPTKYETESGLRWNRVVPGKIDCTLLVRISCQSGQWLIAMGFPCSI